MLFLIFTGCKSTSTAKKEGSFSNHVVEQEKKQDTVMLAVVKTIDIDTNTIELYDVEKGIQLVLHYTGGTEILSKNSNALTMTQLEVGEIVDAYYTVDTNKLTKIQLSASAWEYKDVDNLDINRSEGRMTLANRNYKYENDLSIYSDGEEIHLIDLNDKDKLRIQGIGEKIYSIVVTKGHGYIRLSGYEDFVGGYLEVGTQLFMPVDENMLITAREGEYKLTLEKGNLTGSKYISVRKDQEITVDMSEFKKAPEQFSKIKFVLTPETAVLYINGKAMDTSKIQKLNFGNYTIRAEAEGYESYTGILTVRQSTKSYETISVDLAKQNEIENTSEPTKEPVGDSNTDGTTISETEQENVLATAIPQKDEEHKITVKTPTGADVYMNGVYKGKAPISFTKQIGKLTITLAKDGYTTKSYSVETIDDSEDVEYAFSELVATK